MRNKHLKITILLLLLVLPSLILILTRRFNQPNYLFSSIYKLIFLSPIIYHMILNKKTLKKSILENFSIRTFKKNWAELLKLSLVMAATYLVTFILIKENINLSNITTTLNNLATITPKNIVAIGIYIILFNSLLEEYFWRGFIFKELDQLTPSILTHTLTGISFSFHHILFYYAWFDLGITLTATAGLALFTMTMNLVFKRYKDLFSCWFVHGLVVMVQIYLALVIFGIV